MSFAPGIRLELRQQQSLVLTPQLQQAIRLLQMSNLELAERRSTRRSPRIRSCSAATREAPPPAGPGRPPTPRSGERRDAAATDAAGGDTGGRRRPFRAADCCAAPLRSPSRQRRSTTIVGRSRRA